MKKLIMVVAMVVMSSTFVFAEASFDQIQQLIKEQNYSAAVAGLEVIIKNHPQSAKAFYAMSQAQAGLGNQVKAKEALDKATGLDPELKFASSGNVEKLKEAIQPQTKKIEAIESHFWRNTLILLFGFGIGWFGYTLILKKKKQNRKDVIDSTFGKPSHKPQPVPLSSCNDGVKSSPTKTDVDTMTAGEYVHKNAPSSYGINFSNRNANPTPYAPSHTTVINNSSNDGLVTGLVVGSMLNSHHDTVVHEKVVEREIVREPVVYTKAEPVEQKSSSWDTPEEPKRSSSWDSDSGSSRSSSWDSDSSSSSSSSSWDSGSSSSSDSGSSSSWD